MRSIGRRVLAEHTNHAKHRAPAVAATRLGAVVVHRHDSPPRIEPDSGGPLRPLRRGDVLAGIPAGEHVPLDIWPAVAIQRPHTASWHVIVRELSDIQDWVRSVAIPS